MKRRVFVGTIACFTILVACENMNEPDEPVWGKQPCAHCAMIIGDKRYAAQIVTAGERKFFDDIGCMVGWIQDRKVEPQKSWVHDSTSDRWLDVMRARYATGARTPMDFGFEAVTNGGVSYEEMRVAVLAKKQGAR